MIDYLVTSQELISIADAIRAKGGLGDSALIYPTEFISAINEIEISPVELTMDNASVSLISGTNDDYLLTLDNQSRLITGTFTANSSYGAQSISIPYSGSGYPIAAAIYVSTGAYDSTNTAWYNTVKQYAIGVWSMAKSVQGATPTYGTSGTENYGSVMLTYKSSSTSATSYSRTGNIGAITFNSSDAEGTAAGCVRFKSKTSLSVYVANSSYGFLPGLEYGYIIVYSA